jgi:hypothetical protein
MEPWELVNSMPGLKELRKKTDYLTLRKEKVDFRYVHIKDGKVEDITLTNSFCICSNQREPTIKKPLVMHPLCESLIKKTHGHLYSFFIVGEEAFNCDMKLFNVITSYGPEIFKVGKIETVGRIKSYAQAIDKDRFDHDDTLAKIIQYTQAGYKAHIVLRHEKILPKSEIGVGEKSLAKELSDKYNHPYLQQNKKG